MDALLDDEDVVTKSRKRNVAEDVRISPPNLMVATYRIIGTSPYAQSRFSEKAAGQMRATQEAGSQAKSKRKRAPRNFEVDYEAAKHLADDGWCGIPASAFRNALISACRLVGFKMTLAKLSVFVVADGYDRHDGTALVKLNGKPEMWIAPARNATGVMDLRSRPRWKEWTSDVRVKFDADQFSLADITNLLSRVGEQVGIGEGRHDSRDSTGFGYGCFRVQPRETANADPNSPDNLIVGRKGRKGR